MTASRRFVPVLLLALAVPSLVGARDLDTALYESAPHIIKQLRAKGYREVGVLKFLVAVGGGAPRDDAGELNTRLARRLEVALVLANPDEKLGILKAPGDVIAKKMPGLGHLTAEGREALFDLRYERAWGDPEERVRADAFVTGIARLSKDLSEMRLRLVAFDGPGEPKGLVGELCVKTTPRVLSESGRGYALSPEQFGKMALGRGVPKDRQKEQAAVQPVEPFSYFQTLLNDAEEEQNALHDAEEDVRKATATQTADAAWEKSPVRLTAFVNGVAQTPKGGRIQEPAEGDAVHFELRNLDAKATYAAVLKVNGENTLFRQTDDPWFCRKWVLPPGGSVTVRGYQLKDNDAAFEEFKVLTPSQSREGEVRYGENAGTFRLTVFRGENAPKEAAEPPAPRPFVGAAVAAVTRGQVAPSGVKPLTLEALKADLQREGNETQRGRGLVVPGGVQGKQRIEYVTFKYDSQLPVADVTLRYYEPAVRTQR